METYRVSQEQEPCVLHKFHSPITVVNEKHHVFPQEWQIDLWGKVKDKETWSICSTSHNTVHAAIKYYKKYGDWPNYCTGMTRQLAQLALDRYAAATKELEQGS